jgi:hypothetical protein
MVSSEYISLSFQHLQVVLSSGKFHGEILTKQTNKKEFPGDGSLG